ncbi:MAG: discoidin domain-containing protein [Pirellulaceae bacterium]|nr:discoidin domain-containing protein [Pirellulaceae bacterium]
MVDHNLNGSHRLWNRYLSVWIAVSVLLLVAIHTSGCSPSSDTPPVEPPPPEDVVAPPVEEKPDPAVVWSELLDKAFAHLQADELDETEQLIDELASVYEDPDSLDEQQQSDLDDLKKQLVKRRNALKAKQREENLAAARELMNLGKFTEATEKLSKVTAYSPTAEQREAVRVIAEEIERRRRAQRDMQVWIRLLGTERRKDIIAAQSNLRRNPSVALGMLLEASENTDNPILAANSLETLRLLNQPKSTLPAMVAVLIRTEQQEVWPAAIREIGRAGQPGGGKSLLELALSTGLTEQRAAALTALSQVVDPPNDTVLAVLPLLEDDGPALAPALRAVHHALRVHGQFDLPARRGFDDVLTPEQEQQLTQLPGRLTQLMEKPADDEVAAEVVHRAKVLAYATRQLTPQPLSDVQIHYVQAEATDGPAAAVLDGVWNSVDLKTMWRHPVNERSSITLDLGQSRTVVGVRIWNFNEASGAQRGWKEVDIIVSDSSSEMDPIASGDVPTAPGAAETPDYSTLVPVPFARGRYVRLQAKQLWTSDSHTGLSEVQVLGF